MTTDPQPQSGSVLPTFDLAHFDDLLTGFVCTEPRPLLPWSQSPTYDRAHMFSLLVAAVKMAGLEIRVRITGGGSRIVERTWLAGTFQATCPAAWQIILMGRSPESGRFIDDAIRVKDVASATYTLERIGTKGYRFTLYVEEVVYVFEFIESSLRLAPEWAEQLRTGGDMEPITAANFRLIATTFAGFAAMHNMTVDLLVPDRDPEFYDRGAGDVLFGVPHRDDRLVISWAPNWDRSLVVFPGVSEYAWDGVTLKIKTEQWLLCVTFRQD